MLLGYARVSRPDTQEATLQLDALKKAGVDRIFEDRASGAKWDRPELHRLLDQLRPDDEVVVWKVDRLARSLQQLLKIIKTIEDAHATFRSLTEPIDTSTPAGRMLLQMIGCFAEFERETLVQRTRAGLAAAKARGSAIGRPKKLTLFQEKEAVEMITTGQKTQAAVARLFGVHRSTITRLMKRIVESSEDINDA